MRDGTLEMVSMIGTAVVTAGLFIPVLYFTEKAEAQRPNLLNMEAIEASVAYKSAPAKQPQKKVKAPDPVEKPEGVSHDETKKVEPKKDEPKKPPKKDDTDPLAKFKHPTDDDTPTGKPTTEPGEFNPNAYGWATVTKGHPYWQKLVQDFRQDWEIPQIIDVKGTPGGCFHMTPDGKIPDTLFKDKSGDQVLDDSVQRRLDAVRKMRNENPIPVPTELLAATSGWICFRFDPNGG